MIFSDKTIKEYLYYKKIIIKPKVKLFDIRPTGIRVHLGDKILIPSPGQRVSLSSITDVKYDEYSIKKKSFLLKPNSFVLAATREFIKTPRDIIGFLDGRSTVARLGITAHITASTTDGIIYGEHIVFEIKNVGVFDIELNYLDPIGLLSFIQLTTPVEQEQESKYKNQNGVVAPNLKFRIGVDK